jgi:hypothetical protein
MRCGGRCCGSGGHNLSTLISETLVWDGINWVRKSPGTSPPARYHHAMAFDAARGQIVLFGGLGPSGPMNDTWVWDGANWVQKFPDTSLPAREHHAMAFDGARGEVVPFGGVGRVTVAAVQ